MKYSAIVFVNKHTTSIITSKEEILKEIKYYNLSFSYRTGFWSNETENVVLKIVKGDVDELSLWLMDNL